jgi:outer membrane beta-barrel protein
MRTTCPRHSRLLWGARRCALAIALPLLGAILAGTAHAQEEEDPAVQWEESDKLPAVQNRLYRMEHELSLGVGVLPVNPYYKGVSFTGGYAWHINDLWAVEGLFHYNKNIKTSLRNKIEDGAAVEPTRFAEVLMFGEAGVLFKPIYGKLSLLNDRLVYGELYLSLTGAVAQMEGGKATDEEPEGKGKRLAYGGAPGFGIRGYLSRYISMRFDFRYLMLYSAGEAHFPLTLTLSFGFTTRSDL